MITIHTLQTLQKLRDDPTGHYCLEADIDLGGAQWEPLDFSGILDGKGHKIFNMKICTATADGNQGFFGRVEDGAQVKNLQLTGLKIAGSPEATAIGAVAGCCRGVIKNCTVGADAPYKPTRSGFRNILQGDCDDSYILDQRAEGVAIGAAVGVNTGSVTDIRSYLRLLIPAQMPQGLCGRGEATGLWRDVSNRCELQGKPAMLMRKTIVDYMFAMGDLRWIPSKDLNFTSAYSDGTPVVYGKDVPHYGLPYTQKYGTLERMAHYLKEDDYVIEDLPSYSDAGDKDPANTKEGWDFYLGTDCSGAVFWSWARVCASVSFAYTGHMVPTKENQKDFGVLPVGNYTVSCENTEQVIAENDLNEIMEGYAKLRMADAIVMRIPIHGHTRLVFRDPVVMRDEKGVIDPDESYLPTHEQGVGKGSSGRDSTWQLNCRYTFRELSKNYLPVTNRELLEGAPSPVKVWLEGKTVFSNYRIISTTVTLVPLAGGEPVQSVVFNGVVNRHEEDPGKGDSHARDTVNFSNLEKHLKNLGNLAKGDYQATVSVLPATGTQVLVYEGQCTI